MIFVKFNFKSEPYVILWPSILTSTELRSKFWKLNGFFNGSHVWLVFSTRPKTIRLGRILPGKLVEKLTSPFEIIEFSTISRLIAYFAFDFSKAKLCYKVKF